MSWEISQNSQKNIWAGIYFLIKLYSVDPQLYKKRVFSARCFLAKFAKFVGTRFCRTLTDEWFWLKQYLLSVSYSVSVSSIYFWRGNWQTKRQIMTWKLKHKYQFWPEVKLLKRAVQVKEQVSEAVIHRLQVRCSYKFRKFLRKKICVGVSNKVTGLKICNSIKKKLQHSYFLVKFCKISKNNFFYRTASVAASKVWLAFLKESGTKTGAKVSNKYQI